jgi:peptidyl-tRNA hydrolase, PTH1 family
VRLIVGLGNPGERYRRTRHNVGFMVVDALSAELGHPHWHSESEALVARVEVDSRPVLLVKPQTFMNRSGLALGPLLAEAGSEPSEALAIVDDVVLDLGTLRMRERGSHGGHNGLRSIMETLDSEDFPRLRIGVRKGEQGVDLADYVLAPFPEEDVLVVQEMVGYAAEAVLCAVREGTAVAMSRYNGPLKG